MSRAPLERVVENLKAEGLVSAEAAAGADGHLARLRAQQPWYLRTMVALGAWVASLMLIGFVAGFGLMIGGFIFLGLALVAAALLLRRQVDGDFVVQATLSLSLAGQAIFAWGLAESGSGGEIERYCTGILLLNLLLFFFFPDRIHRVLSVLLAILALVALIYAWGLEATVPVLGPLLAGGLVGLRRAGARLTAAGHGPLLRPAATGLMLGAFGCLMLSTVYLLPELGGAPRFYPHPWISSLLLGGLLLYVAGTALPAGGGRSERALAVGAVLALVAGAWLAPGILLALVVLFLGAAQGERTWVGAAMAFLVVFVVAYFYGMEVSLLAKSMTLTATGAVLLALRWLVVPRFSGGPGEGLS